MNDLELAENKKDETITITLKKQEALDFAHDLSDLICWWQGYRDGRMHKEENFDSVAQNGVDAARQLNSLLKDKLLK